MTRHPSPNTDRLGELLQTLVNRVSHRPGGAVLSLMGEFQITLQQLLLLDRLVRGEATTPSALADSLGMSRSSVSQMLDRLAQAGLVTRREDPADRRQRRIVPTAKAKAQRERIGRARIAEYADGVAPLSPAVRGEMARLLERALAELDAALPGGGRVG